MLIKRSWFVALTVCALGAAMVLGEDGQESEADMVAELRKEVAGGNLQEPDAYVPRLRLEPDQIIGRFRILSCRLRLFEPGVEYTLQKPGQEKTAMVTVRVLQSRREAMDYFLMFEVDPEIALARKRVNLPGLAQGDVALQVGSVFVVVFRNVNLAISMESEAAARELASSVIAHVEREAATNGVKAVPFPKLDVDIAEQNNGKARQVHVRLGVPKGIEYKALVALEREKSGYCCPRLVDGKSVVDARQDERIEVMADVLTRDGYLLRRRQNFPARAEEKAAISPGQDGQESEADMVANLRKEVAVGNLQEPDAYVPRLRFEPNQTIGGSRILSYRFGLAFAHGVEYMVQEPGQEEKAQVTVRVFRSRREAMDYFLMFEVDPEIALARKRVKLPGLTKGDVAIQVEDAFVVTVGNVNLKVISGDRTETAARELVSAVIAYVEREAATNGVKVVPFPKLDVDIGERNDGKARQVHVRVGVPKGVEYEAMVGVGLEKSGYSYPQLVNGECVVDARKDERIEVMVDVLTRDGYFLRRCHNFPAKAEEKKAP